jgi:hypothetical protein
MAVQKIDKEAKATVDKSVEEAKASPEPLVKDLWTDIYYKGTEPPFMRGREREEVTPRISKAMQTVLMALDRSTTISCFHVGDVCYSLPWAIDLMRVWIPAIVLSEKLDVLSTPPTICCALIWGK